VFFGFIVLILGIFICWLSTGMAQNSFGSSYSAISGGSVVLFVGAFVALVGAVFLLMGLFSTMHKQPQYYY
jgi:hypothetical protein